MSNWQRDMIERAVRTFLGACLAAAATGVAGVTDLDSAKAVALAAVATGISAVLSTVARGFGESGSESASFEV